MCTQIRRKDVVVIVVLLVSSNAVPESEYRSLHIATIILLYMYLNTVMYTLSQH